MTGTLAASAVELLQDVARKKEWSSSFSVLINLQRQEHVTTVYSTEEQQYTACIGCSHLALKAWIAHAGKAFRRNI